MLPCNLGNHAAHQNSFVSDFLKFYPDPFILSKDSWDYIVQFWYLDLSMTDTIMQGCYSVFGPQSRLPSCMLRSYLLALKLKVTSITAWYRILIVANGTNRLFVLPIFNIPHNLSQLWK